MDDPITNSLFNDVHMVVKNLCERALIDRKLIVTEVDLQSWIFADLVKNSNILSISEGLVHVHAEINYLKSDIRLGLLPDIVLLPESHYAVDHEGRLHNRKGYTIWGSSIALELKMLRSNRSDGFVDKVIKDIQKLDSIRERHYESNQTYRFYGASVVLCRQPLSQSSVARLEAASAEYNIPLWLFNPSDG